MKLKSQVLSNQANIAINVKTYTGYGQTYTGYGQTYTGYNKTHINTALNIRNTKEYIKYKKNKLKTV